MKSIQSVDTDLDMSSHVCLSVYVCVDVCMYMLTHVSVYMYALDS